MRSNRRVDDTRKAVSDFTAAASRYAALVERCETAEGDDRDAVISELGVQLAELYSRAARIPGIELPEADTDVAGDPEMTTTEFFGALAHLERVIVATFDWGYLEQFHEMKQEDVAWELADDLAEVYHDIRHDLAQLANGQRDGEPTWSNAIWEVRFGFWTHWGHHAVSAMKVMHAHLDAYGMGPWHHHRRGRSVPSVDITSVPAQELYVRTQVGRHMANVARANQQDEAVAFRAAFRMRFDRAKEIFEIYESHARPLAEEGGAGPLTELERGYLKGVDPPQ
jgi:hypothetical protein